MQVVIDDIRVQIGAGYVDDTATRAPKTHELRQHAFLVMADAGNLRELLGIHGQAWHNHERVRRLMVGVDSLESFGKPGLKPFKNTQFVRCTGAKAATYGSGLLEAGW